MAAAASAESPGVHPRTLSRALAATGGAVVVGTSLPGELRLFLPIFVAWALAPYALLALVGSRLSNVWMVAGAGLAALAVEIGIRLAVFVYPRGSTAAIALVFSPAFIAVIAMPLGAIAGWLVSAAEVSGRRWMQAGLLVACAAAWVLTVIGFGRPDLLPTTVLARGKALERIGPPRVAIGAAAFERITVGPPSSWRVIANADGEPGDEIGVVQRDSIQIYSPETLAEQAHLSLGDEAVRRWNWFSKLARANGQLVIAETGGGFQETQVRSLGGTILWRYRPDASLPPSSLVPADLDGDGDGEFFASTNDALVRLDGNGHEVWRTPLVNASIAFTAPRTSRDSGWIVTSTGASTAVITGADGTRIASVPFQNGQASGFVDWPDGRHLLVAGDALRVVRLDGTMAFEWRVPDMTVVQALPITWKPGDVARLAVVAAASRDTKRWRVQIVSRDGTLAFDEVLDTAPGLMKATGPTGSDTLFLNGQDLTALRPIPTAARTSPRAPARSRRPGSAW
jgi:hypothetical protein